MDNYWLNIFIIIGCFITHIVGKNSKIKKDFGILNECDRCQLLSNSFTYWLDKTSRGKFEGGDAAWEAEKLKSYARSEVRLVEVQEGLCSELKRHQDYCYTKAEEAEMLLEKWWKLQNPNSADFYTWLCIDTMQSCCPKNHFGILCSPCPIDSNNKVCGNHGTCDGNGTRIGNGTCLCVQGYDGKFCERCAKNYYSINSECKPCHKSCSECTDFGVNSCQACTNGWQMESGTCVDIDECLNPLTCKDNEYCVNSEGSYSCKRCDRTCKKCLGDGLTNCTLCEPTFVLWSGRCVNDSLKSDILKDTFKRVLLYLGLFISTLFILLHSWKLSSILMLIVAFYIYNLENSLDINMINVFFNMYLY